MLIRRGNLDTETDTTRGQTEVYKTAIYKECLRLPEAKERQETDDGSQPQKERHLPTHWLPTSTSRAVRQETSIV